MSEPARKRPTPDTRVADMTFADLVDALQETRRELPLLLTHDQAAELLGFERHFVGELVRSGHIRTVKLGPGARAERIPRAEVERVARDGVTFRRGAGARKDPLKDDPTRIRNWRK